MRSTSKSNLNDHVVINQPRVRVKIDDSSNATCNVEEEFAAANCECSGCENNTDTDTGICGNDG